MIESSIIIGKFSPPHLGHLKLLETAIENTTGRVLVIVCDKVNQTVKAANRVNSLVASSIYAEVKLENIIANKIVTTVTPDNIHDDDSASWAARTNYIIEGTALKNEVFTQVFTGEDYGEEYSKHLGFNHFRLNRNELPISATQTKLNIQQNFKNIVPEARSHYLKKICFVGAESSGKSTLAEAMAEQHDTVYVPEFGRTYWDGLLELSDVNPNSKDFRSIIELTNIATSSLSRHSGYWMFMDTNEIVTQAFFRRYLGYDDDYNIVNQPELYVLCRHDFDFVQDGTRESESYRDSMFEHMFEMIIKSNIPYIVVSGSIKERMEQVNARLLNIVAKDIII
jgi:HTH-type transcriptional repressor of NAD biosynthesis genes